MLRIACFIQYIQHNARIPCIKFTLQFYRLIKKKISILSPEIQDMFLQIMRNNILLINLTVLLYLNHV